MKTAARVDANQPALTGAELSRHGKEAFTKARPAVLFYTMNSHKPTGRGARGLFDHLLIDAERGWLAFVEVKGGRDKISAVQAVFATAIQAVCALTPRVVYRVVKQAEDWDFLLNYEVVEDVAIGATAKVGAGK